jgi:hypothetical protein
MNVVQRTSDQINVETARLIIVNGLFDDGFHSINAGSAALTEFDPKDIRLVTVLAEGESVVPCEIALKRVNQQYTTILDVFIFLTLWQCKECIPEDWKDKKVVFAGMILLNWCGHYCVPYIYWSDERGWSWTMIFLKDEFFGDELLVRKDCFFAVLDNDSV